MVAPWFSYESCTKENTITCTQLTNMFYELNKIKMSGKDLSFVIYFYIYVCGSSSCLCELEQL